MRVASYLSAASGWRPGVLWSEAEQDGRADAVGCAWAIVGGEGPSAEFTVRELLAASTLSCGLATAVAAAAARPVIRRAAVGQRLPDPDKILCMRLVTLTASG